MADTSVILVALGDGIDAYASFPQGLEEEEKVLTPFQPLHQYQTHVIRNSTDASLTRAIKKHREQLTIVHLSAHAYSQQETTESWMPILGQLKSLQVVFLSGCATHELVHKLLEQGVPGVIAIPKEAEAGLHFRFIGSFYEALAKEHSLLNAFEQAGEDLILDDPSFPIPSAVFFNPEKKQKVPFSWGLYLYPVNQDILSWKIQTAPSPDILPPSPVPAYDPKEIIPPRKKRGLFGGLKLNVLENLFSILPKKTSTRPILHELPSSRSEESTPISPRLSGGGLENSVGKADDFLEKIALAQKTASPESLIQLEALAEKWKTLSTSFKQKTLVQDVVKKRPPFIVLTPGRIEGLIESAISAELFELRSQLLEKELEALNQPVSRGFVLRKPIVKSEVGKYHALIIGINSYEDPGINSLNEALEDAKLLHQLLSDTYYFDHIKLLENPDRSTILNAFGEMQRNIEEGDNVLIFYAGHGKWDKEYEIGYWLPSDAHHEMRSNWIENSSIHNEIKRFKDCQHVLLISDSCFSGALLDTRDVTGPSIKQDDKDIQILYKAKSRQILTSGAKEPVPDDSVFFNSLLKTLKDLPDDTFSTHALFHQVRTEVLNDLRIGQNPQVGKILHAGDDGGDFVFFRK